METIIDGPLGKVIYHTIWADSEVHGWPYIHYFLSVLNAPTLIVNTKDEYVSFVDKTLHIHLPEKCRHLQLHDLVKLSQLHRHSKTFWKYKNQVFRFSFGFFVAIRTIVAESFPNIPEKKTILLLQKGIDIIAKVIDYVNNYFYSSK